MQHSTFYQHWWESLYCRDLGNNDLTGRIPKELSALVRLSILCAFFTWEQLPSTCFQLIEYRSTYNMPPFINISSNLFEQKVPPQKPIKWPHSDTTFGIDCITDFVRFFYMDTFSQHVFSSLQQIGRNAAWHLLSTSNKTCLNKRDLSSNRLEGPIPAQLSNLTELQYLCAFFTWIHQSAHDFQFFIDLK